MIKPRGMSRISPHKIKVKKLLLSPTAKEREGEKYILSAQREVRIYIVNARGSALRWAGRCPDDF